MRSPSTGNNPTDGGTTRRTVLQGGLAAGLAGVSLAALGDVPASATVPVTAKPAAAPALLRGEGIHPFRVSVPKERLRALRRRVADTTWPSTEPEPHRAGVDRVDATTRLRPLCRPGR